MLAGMSPVTKSNGTGILAGKLVGLQITEAMGKAMGNPYFAIIWHRTTPKRARPYELRGVWDAKNRLLGR
jgi:hypothetical protein